MENDACFNITPHSLLLLSTQTKLGVAVFPTLSTKSTRGGTWDCKLHDGFPWDDCIFTYMKTHKKDHLNVGNIYQSQELGTY